MCSQVLEPALESLGNTQLTDMIVGVGPAGDVGEVGDAQDERGSSPYDSGRVGVGMPAPVVSSRPSRPTTGWFMP